MQRRIRQAQFSDFGVVADFNMRLASETENKVLDRNLVVAGVQAALIDQSKGIYFLAEENGGVVGQLQITTEWSDWRNGWFWWIQGVYVTHDYRRKGVFRSLYQHVEEMARADSSVIGLRLYVERENVSAQNTYRRMGMGLTNYLMYEKYPLE